MVRLSRGPLLVVLLVLVFCQPTNSAFTLLSTLTTTFMAAPYQSNGYDYYGGSFGYSLVVQGTTVIIGAWQQADPNSSDGLVYVHNCTNPFNCTQYILRPVTRLSSDYYFGASVSISGHMLVVGVPGYNSYDGAGFLYDCSDLSNCTLRSILTAAVGSSFLLGYSVTISGTLVGIGSGSSGGSNYLFDCRDPTNCVLGATVGGSSTARSSTRIAVSGSLFVLGNPVATVGGNTQQGTVSVYTCTIAASCTFQSSLVPSDPTSYLYFGFSLSISGNLVTINSHNNNNNVGEVYLFDCTNPASCVQKSFITTTLQYYSEYGFSNILSSDSIAIIGQPYLGTYIFDCQNVNACVLDTTIPTSIDYDPQLDDEFGFAVSISGPLAIVGSFNTQIKSAGKAFLFGIVCSNGTSFNATWPQTLAGESGTYTCQPNYYASNPTVPCTQNRTTAYWGANPCQPVNCLTGSSGNASWTQTMAGSYGNFTCLTGYYASNTSVHCLQSGGTGVWASSPCQPVYCNATASGNATWVKTQAGITTNMTCNSGYFSNNTSATCIQSGPTASWSAVTFPCSPVYCAPGNSTEMTWNSALAGTSVHYTCNVGYYSTNPLVSCIQSGATASWGSIAVPCTPVYCGNVSASNTDWYQTLAGTLTNGTCQSGYYGFPTRLCNQAGAVASFGAISGTCDAVSCDHGSSQNATWLKTLSGTTGIYSCNTGFYSSDPEVPCIQTGPTAYWGDIAATCNPVYCLGEDFGNATWLQSQAFGVTSGTCDAGFYGNPTRTCTQGGDTGYWGLSVTPPCRACDCSVAGSTASTCTSNGVCSCNTGYSGDQCNQCAATYYTNGSYCAFCGCGVGDAGSGLCSGLGACTCKVNFADSKCSTCNPGFYLSGSSCLDCQCNSTGSVSANCSSSGVCTCAAGFTGNQCDQCAPGYAGPFCEACRPGTYQSIQGQGACFPCQANANSSSGSTSCSCRNGFRLQGQQCVSDESNLPTGTPPSVGDTQIEKWILYVVYAAFFLLVVIFYLVLRRKSPLANNSMVITSGLAIFDFVTGCLFVWEMSIQPDNEAIYLTSLVTLSLSYSLNIILVFYVILTQLRKSEAVEQYLQKYSWIAAAVAFLSGANFGVLSILNSGIADSPMFKINWSPATELKVSTLGLVGNIVEDIPQFVIQVIGVSKYGSSSAITVVSLVATSVSLFLSLLRRSFLFLVLRHGPTAQRKRETKKGTLRAEPTEMAEPKESIEKMM